VELFTIFFILINAAAIITNMLYMVPASDLRRKRGLAGRFFERLLLAAAPLGALSELQPASGTLFMSSGVPLKRGADLCFFVLLLCLTTYLALRLLSGLFGDSGAAAIHCAAASGFFARLPRGRLKIIFGGSVAACLF
jgi:hypothetical protein